MVTPLDRQTQKYMQRKASQQVTRQALYGKKADPERLRLIAAANVVRPVRVLPKDPETRKNLKHQPSKIAFRAEGSVEWPLDKFTLRRLRDGDITIVTDDVDAQVTPTQARGTTHHRSTGKTE
jgi:hypothetical protein